MMVKKSSKAPACCMELQPPDRKPYGRSVGANDSQRSTCPVIPPHHRPCSHRWTTGNIFAGGRISSQFTPTDSRYEGLRRRNAVKRQAIFFESTRASASLQHVLKKTTAASDSVGAMCNTWLIDFGRGSRETIYELSLLVRSGSKGSATLQWATLWVLLRAVWFAPSGPWEGLLRFSVVNMALYGLLLWRWRAVNINDPHINCA